jgi:hypothetical protein
MDLASSLATSQYKLNPYCITVFFSIRKQPQHIPLRILEQTQNKGPLFCFPDLNKIIKRSKAFYMVTKLRAGEDPSPPNEAISAISTSRHGWKEEI